MLRTDSQVAIVHVQCCHPKNSCTNTVYSKVDLCFDFIAQVPGQLLGHGNVDLAIQYADSRDVLYLRLANQPVVYAYPGMSKLYYKNYTHYGFYLI